jgi:predicted SAM-dependent methyltransferase
MNLFEEFEFTVNKLPSSKSSFAKIRNILNESLSLNITNMIQLLGANKRLYQRSKDNKIYLNIGCGENFHPDFINTDVAPSFCELIKLNWILRPRKARCFLNITYRDKWLSEVADGIVFSHVLEHVKPNQIIAALENINAYLKPGGVLRISVPDLSTYDQDPVPADQCVKTTILAKNSLVYDWGHKFMFDAPLLTALLEKVGFVDVHVVNFNEGAFSNANVERRQGETLTLMAHKMR